MLKNTLAQLLLFFIIPFFMFSCKKDGVISDIVFFSVVSSTDVLITDSTYVIYGDDILTFGRNDLNPISFKKNELLKSRTQDGTYSSSQTSADQVNYINNKVAMVPYGTEFHNLKRLISSDTDIADSYFKKYMLSPDKFIISNDYIGSFITEDQGETWQQMSFSNRGNVKTIGHYPGGVFMVVDDNNVFMYDLKNQKEYFLFDGDTTDLYDEIVDVNVYKEDTVLLTRNGVLYEKRKEESWIKRTLWEGYNMNNTSTRNIEVAHLPDSFYRENFLVRTTFEVGNRKLVTIVDLEEVYSVIGSVDEMGIYYQHEKLEDFILNDIQRIKDDQLIVLGNSNFDNRVMLYLGKIIFEKEK